MEHIVIKEKHILSNVLKQVHHLPEMKLNSEYSGKNESQEAWILCYALNLNSIVCLCSHNDFRKAKKIGKRAVVNSGFYMHLSNNGICNKTLEYNTERHFFKLL